MPNLAAKNYNLPWHQYDQYWICLFSRSGKFSSSMQQALQQMGLQVQGEALAIKTGSDWKGPWDTLYGQLQTANIAKDVEIAVAPGETPSLSREMVNCRTPAAVQAIAESLWLGNALLDNRLLCYLQPVMVGKDQIFGYESFARVKMPDGSIVGGDKIVAASHALHIEYTIDRYLHVQAINTFAASAFNGFLFINFFPGFIHRPEVYLEGLSATAKGLGIVAKNLVLEFTKSEIPRDIVHLRNVCDYGRSKGYSLALDDISSLDNIKKLSGDMRPDFVKIDMQMAHNVQQSGVRDVIKQIVDFVHKSGGKVIAEGVESEDMFEKLKALGVDLFQGYYFSAPVPVEKALKRSNA